ncbi:MAG: hypothetical protein D6732_08410 [Methanobacteriota archaeon]|nr:MAG: hypothetical protein D6732_08410 [Euryarchaeota archaeon]
MSFFRRLVSLSGMMANNESHRDMNHGFTHEIEPTYELLWDYGLDIIGLELKQINMIKREAARLCPRKYCGEFVDFIQRIYQCAVAAAVEHEKAESGSDYRKALSVVISRRGDEISTFAWNKVVQTIPEMRHAAPPRKRNEVPRDLRRMFIKRLPPETRGTNNFEDGLFNIKSWQSYVFAPAYVSLGDRTRTMLTADIDHQDWYERLIESGAPMPNFAMVNPVNGHAHLVWMLKSPVRKRKRKSWSYGRDVQKKLGIALGGDPYFAGKFIKNPFSGQHKLHILSSKLYVLSDFQSAIDGVMLPTTRFAPEWSAVRNGGSIVRKGHRNNFVFENLRRYAYSTVRNCKSHAHLSSLCEIRAIELNRQCWPMLPDSEINSIARSVSQWTWERRSSIFPEIQYIRKHPDLSPKEAMGLHSRRTGIRNQKRIKNACRKAISLRDAAKIAGMSAASASRLIGLAMKKGSETEEKGRERAFEMLSKRKEYRENLAVKKALFVGALLNGKPLSRLNDEMRQKCINHVRSKGRKIWNDSILRMFGNRDLDQDIKTPSIRTLQALTGFHHGKIKKIIQRIGNGKHADNFAKEFMSTNGSLKKAINALIHGTKAWIEFGRYYYTTLHSIKKYSHIVLAAAMKQLYARDSLRYRKRWTLRQAAYVM